MGVIAQQVIELQPKLDEMFWRARWIDDHNDEDVRNRFDKSVHLLRPFSYEFKSACKVFSYEGHNGEKYYHDLMVGEWLREKASYQSHGSVVDHVLSHIQEHGPEIVEVVRPAIKEAFAEVAALSKQLRMYEEMCVSRVGMWDTRDINLGTWRNQVGVGGFTMKEMHVTVGRPTVLYFWKTDGFTGSLDIHDWYSIHVLEDVIDEVVGLYRSLYGITEEAERHNEAVFAKMNEAMAPYAVARALG